MLEISFGFVFSILGFLLHDYFFGEYTTFSVIFVAFFIGLLVGFIIRIGAFGDAIDCGTDFINFDD